VAPAIALRLPFPRPTPHRWYAQVAAIAVAPAGTCDLRHESECFDGIVRLAGSADSSRMA